MRSCLLGMNRSTCSGLATAIVVVHDGFLGPWLSRDVRQILEVRGVRPVAPDLPSVGDRMVIVG